MNYREGALPAGIGAAYVAAGVGAGLVVSLLVMTLVALLCLRADQKDLARLFWFCTRRDCRSSGDGYQDGVDHVVRTRHTVELVDRSEVVS